MGLNLEFLLGDEQAIVAAMETFDLDRLDEDEVVHDSADLSLHIVPKDLDRLSRCLAKYSGKMPMDLRPSLTVAVDSEDGGAFLIAREWIEYVAALPEPRLDEVVADWIADMRREYDEPEIVVTEAALAGVRDLWGLCRRSLATGASLVHVWWP